MLKIHLKCLILLINLLSYSKLKKRNDETSQSQMSIIENTIHKNPLTLKYLNRMYI